MTWSAKITGVDEVAPEMQAAVDAGTQAGLEVLGTKGAEIVQENISTPYGALPPAVAFGNLVASIVSKYSRDATMQMEIIGVGPTLGADVYAAPVETGTVPHMPPPSALVPWVMQKLDVEDEKQAMSVAFAIAKKISQRGTQGHFMFERALDELEPMAAPALEAAIAQALAAAGFTGAQA